MNFSNTRLLHRHFPRAKLFSSRVSRTHHRPELKYSFASASSISREIIFRGYPLLKPNFTVLPSATIFLQRALFQSLSSATMSDDKNQSGDGATTMMAEASSDANENSTANSESNDNKNSGESQPEQDGNNNNKNGNKNKKGKNWKFNKNQKNKKKPWYRNRGEKKRQKVEDDEGNTNDEEGGEGGSNEDNENNTANNNNQEGGDLKRKGKNERRKEDFDSRDQTPHEGSFANENMQKMFNITVEKPTEVIKENKDETKSAEEEKGTEGDTNNEETVKFPKRKLALLVSFLGTNYSGFQINAAKNTLQAQLELALHRAGIINSDNFGYPSKYSWSSSARTDKGVHAAAQVCSVKGHMIFHTEGEDALSTSEQLDAMRAKVNEHLPDDIRIIDIERVTRNFCARTNRDKVRYQYMVPSFMLCSREEVRKAFAAVEGKVTATKPGEKNMTPMEASNIIEETITPEVTQQARSILYKHRVTPDRLECLRKGLKVFEGTHPFHNYTRRIGGKEASAMRYIISFTALDPIVMPGKVNDDGSKEEDMEWIPVQIVGQSFLLNQIRKMISGAVDLGREVASEEQIRESLKKHVRMKVNVAPAQGLFLDRSYFDLYNKMKVKKTNQSGGGHDHDQLDWAGSEDYPAVKRIEEFKNEKIIPHIVQEEQKEGNFLKYMFAQDILHANEVYTLLGDNKSNDNGRDDEGDEDVVEQ